MDTFRFRRFSVDNYKNNCSDFIRYPVSGIRYHMLLITILTLTICSFVVPNKVSAQIGIRAYFDSTAILIGDQIHFNLFVDQPLDAKVTIPEFRDSIVGKVVIVSDLKADTASSGNGRLKILKRYLITSFDSGVYKVDSLKFGFTMGNVKDTISSLPVALAVFPIPIKDPNKMFDIKGIEKVPLTLAEIMRYVLIIWGILIVIGIAVYIIVRIKQNKPIIPVFKPAEPAHVIAFRELEKLKNEKLWQQGQFKQYYTRLTDIIRQYIENRYNVLAMESTSEEIIADLKKLKIENKKVLDNLAQMLEISDLVKFAKAEPLPEENENSWKYSNDFVLNTMIKQEEVNQPVETPKVEITPSEENKMK